MNYKDLNDTGNLVSDNGKKINCMPTYRQISSINNYSPVEVSKLLDTMLDVACNEMLNQYNEGNDIVVKLGAFGKLNISVKNGKITRTGFNLSNRFKRKIEQSLKDGKSPMVKTLEKEIVDKFINEYIKQV